MANWSKLPYDIIQTIAIRLEVVEDFLSFSAVCRSWRSFYLAKQWTAGSQVPWLMLSEDESRNRRRFFSLYRDKEYELELPEAQGRRCWGSCDGWLVTICSNLEIHLLNAFTRHCIRLPAQNGFEIHFDIPRDWYQFIDKAILIKKPDQQRMASEENFLVMAIYGPYKQLAFTKPGFASWINVVDSTQYRLADVASLNDQVFALSDMGTLLVIDIDSQPPNMEIIASPPHVWSWEQLFLVESSGDLLAVYKSHRVNPYDPSIQQIQFEVHKFDFGVKEWKQLEDLGDKAIFVGDNNRSISVPASKFANCKGNSIYFTGSTVENWWTFDENISGRDSGVYRMADGIVEPFFFGADYHSYYSCPVWITPSLC